MEYNFRAYHKTQKRMFPVYGLGTSWLTEDTFDGVDPGQNCFDGDQMKDLIVMQFSGKFTWQGYRIYDGDIIRMDSIPIKFICRYDEDVCAFVFDVYAEKQIWNSDVVLIREKVDTIGVYEYLKDGYIQGHLIGNIYEHPTKIYSI